ncbi:MAG: tetratricopeptide repeat protein [Bacillota bacterium]
MTKNKLSYRARKKLQQRIVMGILAAVLSLGLLGSSVVWTLDRSNVVDTVPRQDPPKQVTAAELEEKAKASPNDVEVLKDLAMAYEREGQNGKAVETYEKAVSLAPDREDLKTRLSGGLITTGQYDRAVKILQEVLGRSPGNKEAHYYYGHALVAKREYGKAVEEFEHYIKLAGENDPQTENVKRIIETLKPLINKPQ